MVLVERFSGRVRTTTGARHHGWTRRLFGERGWPPEGSGLSPACLGSSPFQPPVLEAGEATSPLPDQASVVANPDTHHGAQVLQRAGGGPAFLDQGHWQDERVGHVRIPLQFHLPEATAAGE